MIDGYLLGTGQEWLELIGMIDKVIVRSKSGPPSCKRSRRCSFCKGDMSSLEPPEPESATFRQGRDRENSSMKRRADTPPVSRIPDRWCSQRTAGDRNDCSEKLSTFTKPVLIIQGKQDVLDQSIAQKAHAVLKKSNLVLLDNCAHYGWLDRPEMYFDVINKFINAK